MTYDNFIAKLNDEFPGYHIEIMLYPSGGMIEVNGCEECKTSESVNEIQSWRKGSKTKTLDEAVILLKEKLKQ